ncbi:hypothetical protein [Halorhabdus sp. BNX81]|uniref:hypothetical protein n=1 Tax=Halorhabdus sp. BNX81 TaxID=2980181 RepID=UPI0023DD35D0|nr:hypothetical protein [Halorhabdus sp. BNX81]
MSLSRDALLFSILLMVWVVQIETGGVDPIAEQQAKLPLFIGGIALLGSVLSSLYSMLEEAEPESSG